MNSLKPQKSHGGLREVGINHVLLTDAESRCFDIARNYQRKGLVRSLAPRELWRWRNEFHKLGWSKNGLVLGIQGLILALALIPMSLWLIAKCCLRLILFPYRYLLTFIVPKDLKAPGEKTLVGLHNAFHSHLNLGATDYIACLNDWIKILYGEKTLDQHNLQQLMETELKKVHYQGQNDDLSGSLRSVVAVSREKLSKELGHYLKSQRVH